MAHLIRRSLLHVFLPPGLIFTLKGIRTENAGSLFLSFWAQLYTLVMLLVTDSSVVISVIKSKGFARWLLTSRSV